MSKDRDTFSPVGENHGSSYHHDDRKTSNVGDSLSDCDILDLGDDCYESLDRSRAYDASLDQEISPSTDSNPQWIFVFRPRIWLLPFSRKILYSGCRDNEPNNFKSKQNRKSSLEKTSDSPCKSDHARQRHNDVPSRCKDLESV